MRGPVAGVNQLVQTSLPMRPYVGQATTCLPVQTTVYLSLRFLVSRRQSISGNIRVHPYTSILGISSIHRVPNGPPSSYKSKSGIQRKLPPFGFERIHRGWIRTYALAAFVTPTWAGRCKIKCITRRTNIRDRHINPAMPTPTSKH